MAHYGGGETGGRRLETLRVLPHLRVGMGLPDALRPATYRAAGRPRNRTRFIYAGTNRRRLYRVKK